MPPLAASLGAPAGTAGPGAASAVSTPETREATLLPSHSLLDLIAFLIIFLCLPSPVSCVLLGLHALSAYSRAAAARVFSRLLHAETGPAHHSPRPGDFLYLFREYRLSAALLFTGHAVIALFLAFFFPVSLKGVHLFANALAASTLAGSPKRTPFVNAMLSSIVVLALDRGYNYGVGRFNLFVGTSFGPHLGLIRPPGLRFASTVTLLSLPHCDWYRLHTAMFDLTSMVLAVLAVHTILLSILPLLRNIFLLQNYTRTLDQLASIAPEYPVSRHSPSARLRVVATEPVAAPMVANAPVVVHVSPKIVASSSNVFLGRDLQPLGETRELREPPPLGETRELREPHEPLHEPPQTPHPPQTPQTPHPPHPPQTPQTPQTPHPSQSPQSPLSPLSPLSPSSPAAFPAGPEVSPDSELSLSGSVVSANFYNYCMSSISEKRGKNPNWAQPLWALVATARAMYGRNDVYLGELHTACETALVPAASGAAPLSQSYYSDNTLENSRGFVNYIGETAVGFLVPGMRGAEGLVVKVNGVTWYQVTEAMCGSDTLVLVSGLTPLSQYDIELLVEEEVISSNIVSTTHNTTTMSLSKMTSPLITLQESLITTNENLAREKTKLRKTRKEITKKVGVLKREIDALRSGLDNQRELAGSADSRSWRKLVSLRANVSQVQDENKGIEEEVSRVLEEENEVSEWHLEEKRRFEAEIRTLQTFLKSVADETAAGDAEVAAAEAELVALTAKRDKMQVKIVKAEAEVTRLERGLEEFKTSDITRRIEMRKARSARRDELIREFVREIERLEDAIKAQSYGAAGSGALLPKPAPPLDVATAGFKFDHY